MTLSTNSYNVIDNFIGRIENITLVLSSKFLHYILIKKFVISILIFYDILTIYGGGARKSGRT